MNEPNDKHVWREAMTKANNGPRIAITCALAMLTIFLLVMTIDDMHNWGHPDQGGPDTITVTGQGMATAIPDTATISFGATATASDVATAETTMTNTINNALSGVKAQGVSSDDITTTSYTVSPHYTNPVCPPGLFCPAVSSTVSGYDVSENIQVKVHDLTKVSAILGVLAKANVTNVSGPEYVVGDMQSVVQQARAQAIQQAQADAKVLAQQLGVHLGKVTDFEDNTNSGVVAPTFNAMAGVASSAAAPAPSVPVGSNEYTDNVSITYQIQ